MEYLSFTPLHFAACNGCVESAKALLRHGASPKLKAGTVYWRIILAIWLNSLVCELP